jgi:hypothetical protein
MESKGAADEKYSVGEWVKVTMPAVTFVGRVTEIINGMYWIRMFPKGPHSAYVSFDKLYRLCGKCLNCLCDVTIDGRPYYCGDPWPPALSGSLNVPELSELSDLPPIFVPDTSSFPLWWKELGPIPDEYE